ncbi:MAG: Rrf2 family transcriptional regulator [Deltaproteobacteria bacterium]|nr:Rrf2 family transcriptional regulator [Deltaproteobacteria bacterium]
MKLSTRGRYGTRLMIELSRHYGSGPLSTSQISKNQNIPIKYLEQLVIPLKKAKLIKSVRGPRGGHMLARAPEKISVWELLDVLESKFTFADCLKNPSICENVSTCPVRPVWGKALNLMMKHFRETSLKDVSRTEESHRP